MSDVFIDEKFVGIVDSGSEFASKLRKERQEGKLPNEINFYYDKKLDEVNLETSKGRARRPLIIVENGKSKLTQEMLEKCKNNEMSWNDLITNSIIEYLD